MIKFKKIIICMVVGFMLFSLSGCVKKENVEGKLEDIMKKVYADIKEEERPMMLNNIELTKENVENYLGTSDIEFDEGMASESAVGSIAHSVVLIRVKDNADVEAIKDKIEESVNPRKWICVEAEEVEVESKGNLIILIMADKTSVEKIDKAFKNL